MLTPWLCARCPLKIEKCFPEMSSGGSFQGTGNQGFCLDAMLHPGKPTGIFLGHKYHWDSNTSTAPRVWKAGRCVLSWYLNVPKKASPELHQDGWKNEGCPQHCSRCKEVMRCRILCAFCRSKCLCLPQPSRLSQQAIIHLHPASLASPLLLAQRFLVKNPSKLQKSSDKQPEWLYRRKKSVASTANLGSDMETVVILHAAAEEYLSGESGAVRHPCSPCSAAFPGLVMSHQP